MHCLTALAGRLFGHNRPNSQSDDYDDLRPLVYHPSIRECPPEVRRGLRAIDPTAELVYLRNGMWLLGCVRPNRIRTRKAIRIMESLNDYGMDTTAADATPERIEQVRWERYGKLMVARLVLQGFSPIKLYYSRQPDSSIVRDFAWRDWLYRTNADAEFAARQDEVEGGPEQRAMAAAFMEAIRVVGPEAHRRAFGTGRSYHVNGLRKRA